MKYISRLSGADCAGEFDVADPEDIEPGSVMVLDEEGKLRKGSRPFDRTVGCSVGTISTERNRRRLDPSRPWFGRLAP